MKKLFICSDIHSFYDEWMSALADKGFDPSDENHIIVVLGDLLDRGDKTIECLQFVNNLPESRKILILGNHEDLLKKVFEKRFFQSHDYSNGTYKTCCALANFSEDDLGCASVDIIDRAKENPEIWKYLDQCIDYYELDNYIFVHGWIPCYYQEVWGEYYNFEYNPDWRNANRKSWNEARWINGMNAWSRGVKEPGKTIMCGHYHTSWGNAFLHEDGVDFLEDGIEEDREHGIYENFNPFRDDGILAIDSCVAWTKKINCEVIEIEDEEGTNESNSFENQREVETT